MTEDLRRSYRYRIDREITFSIDWASVRYALLLLVCVLAWFAFGAGVATLSARSAWMSVLQEQQRTNAQQLAVVERQDAALQGCHGRLEELNAWVGMNHVPEDERP